MEGCSSSMSKDQLRAAFIKMIDASLSPLHHIWDKMGFDDNQRKSRGDTAIYHVRNLMEDMLKEEDILMNKVAKTIEEYSKKLKELCVELSVSDVKLSGNLTMVQKEKILRTRVDAYTKEKNERMSKFKDLHGKDEILCESLSTTPYFLPSGTVPSLEQLKELETHVNNMQNEKKKRLTAFTNLKQKICHLYNEMECDPESSFSRDVVCEEDDAFVLSEHNIDQLKLLHVEVVAKDQEMKNEVDDLWDRLRALWNRLETSDICREGFEFGKEGHGTSVIATLKAEIATCEQLKFQNIRKFIDGTRTELETWWNRCFISVEQRKKFTPQSEDEYTEDLLQAHEQELESLREYYKTHKDLLDKVAKREELFKNMVVFEEKASDPNRFFNDRGGKLLQEEKARKRLMKELPKVEEDVIDCILKWEAEHNREFLVNGMRFTVYTEKQWNDFHMNKEQEKQNRMKAKAKQTQDEAMFGSKAAAVPNKRRIGNAATPVRTPLKTRKMNEALRTPNTTSRLPNSSRFQHSTIMHSPFNRQALYTPKTPVGSTKKRRSLRLMKKAATERKLSSNKRKFHGTFSQTTLSGDEHGTSSLASTGSYKDFANGLSRPECRSSVAAPIKLW